MSTKMTTFLMFTGRAEEAMTFYTSLFPNSQITSMKKYGPNEGGPEGTVMVAEFSLNGHSMACIDSPIQHAFNFTPSTSILVTCDSAEEVDRLHKALSEGGSMLMPVGEYPFARRYCWLNDRFGVSWQLKFAG